MLMGHACILGALDATSKMAAGLFSDKVPPPAPAHSLGPRSRRPARGGGAIKPAPACPLAGFF